ncbi:toll/interleukin-1 receptor domain-containing protein [Streptomyces akebiae]|uniref:Toll/interleukin-1 receptor domain-containing protein n=1 Tax=Streptomyces akebiae TaxID=2865673 RepID=A0ABX8XUY8_9ACTN|nr:toll/interleukin-1 receptor domain-containing protein [Streptomyces akebiae]
MSRCTAPRRGHRTASGRAACPACGGGGYGYSPSRSYYPPPAYTSQSSGGGGATSGGSSSSGRTRAPWSPSTSSVTYTPAEVKDLTPARDATVMRARQQPALRDVFLCHAWDDRRGSAKELCNLLETKGVSVWFSEKDIPYGLPFMREIDKGLAKSRTGLVLVTPALLTRLERGGVSDKELSELLARNLLLPVVHGTTYGELRNVSPLLASRNGFDTAEDSMAVVATKIAELVAVEDDLTELPTPAN